MDVNGQICKTSRSRLFNMATSNAASERNFSTMGFIHSKLRNSLSAKIVEKLVFIKSNMGAFYNCPMSDDYTSESDSDHAGLN